MNFLLFILTSAIIASGTAKRENERLKRENQLLLQKLSEVAIGQEASCDDSNEYCNHGFLEGSRKVTVFVKEADGEGEALQKFLNENLRDYIFPIAGVGINFSAAGSRYVGNWVQSTDTFQWREDTSNAEEDSNAMIKAEFFVVDAKFDLVRNKLLGANDSGVIKIEGMMVSPIDIFVRNRRGYGM